MHTRHIRKMHEAAIHENAHGAYTRFAHAYIRNCTRVYTPWRWVRFAIRPGDMVPEPGAAWLIHSRAVPDYMIFNVILYTLPQK